MSQETVVLPVGSRTQEAAAAGAGTELFFAEMTQCTAKFTDSSKSDVNLTADGYIRTQYLDAKLVSAGWMDIQADGEAAPYPALVIYVEELSSANSSAVPRTYHAFDNVVSPPQLVTDRNPSVVFCGLEPGPDKDTPPPVLGQMRKTRIRVV